MSDSQSFHYHIEVDISTQTLRVFYRQELIKTYQVSTAKNGPGEEFGSEKTPRGWHVIRAKIGQGRRRIPCL